MHYFVDHGLDAVIENANEGIDTVHSTIDYSLTANVENLVLQGTASLQGYGNSLSNSTATAGTTSSTAAPRPTA